jgi:hypothetical protein
MSWVSVHHAPHLVSEFLSVATYSEALGCRRSGRWGMVGVPGIGAIPATELPAVVGALIRHAC